MGTRTIKLPDVGEGVAEAELVEWHVAVGDPVREDMVLAAVMTDKATVEIPSPVEGTVAWLGGEVGDMLAVGAPLLRIEIAGKAGDAAPAPAEATPASDASDHAEVEDAEPVVSRETAPPPPAASPPPVRREAAETQRPTPPTSARAPRSEGDRPLASPALRRRAMEAGVDLRRVPGSGPAGRITGADLDAYLERGEGGAAPGVGRAADTSVTEVRVVGLRRRIAERMALARDRIVPITYVEEIDCQALEDLRATLNAAPPGGAGAGTGGRAKLTLLPFLVRAIVVAVREQPAMNAHFDDEAGLVRQFGGVHVGIAAQTPAGLVVPVLRHAEARGLFDAAAEIARLAKAAKEGGASREELTGSTITVTSLGAMGGIATTPVINHPEVAIVGVNRMEVRPVWDGARFVPRKRMNLSSSFDHRVVDGWDAAVFVQRIKGLLESPATLFIES